MTMLAIDLRSPSGSLRAPAEPGLAIAIALLGACSFSPGVGGDAGTTGDVPDGAGSDVLPVDAPDATPPDPGFVRSIDLTDALVVGTHTSFPFLLRLNAQSWLRSSANGGDVVRIDGFDIHFSLDQQGGMPLDFELESYAPLTGDIEAWIRVPSLTPQTVLYMHYGDPAITTNRENAAAVWTNAYELVLHMDGAGDATGKSTSNNGTNVGAGAGIGVAGIFDGTTSVYNAGSGAAVDNIWAGGGNAEGWFFATSYGENSRGRLFDKGALQGWTLFLNNDSAAMGSVSFIQGGSGDGQWYGPTNSISLGAWHHISCNYNKDANSNDPTIYLDGIAITLTQTITPFGIDDDAANDLLVGNTDDGSRTFHGLLDEMRLSSATRSADWVLTQFRNHASPAAFFTVSAPL